MTTNERAHYHAVLWPAACRAKGWHPKDAEIRREIVLVCMQEVRGPVVTTSDPAFGPDETTALFCFLEHLADAASLDKSARWDTCKQDYRTYNRARQADWHERKLYGPGKNKLDRHRFGGAASAAGGALDTLDAEAVRKRHLTFASRHQKKQRREKGENLASQKTVGMIGLTPDPQIGAIQLPAIKPRAANSTTVAAWDEDGPF